MAASNGYKTVVGLLLADPRVDPSANDSIAIQKAAVATVALLPADKRCDPSANNTTFNDNAPLCQASLSGHMEIVKLLLADPRINPFNTDALLSASRNGHLDIMNLLLTDPRVDPSRKDNSAFCGAVCRCQLEAIKRLLQDPRVDPAAGGNAPLRAAVQNNDSRVLSLLLGDPRVDPMVVVLGADYHWFHALRDVLLGRADISDEDRRVVERLADCSEVLMGIVDASGVWEWQWKEFLEGWTQAVEAWNDVANKKM
ncbi:UNVERIFIED_CONTAM: hypothetical protein HDU68_007457 [Siphonaria sp. JEL0065]|nr:hypothetical protein HDU68_007457 [Siphonaria sp. JEL0065]